MSHGDEVVDTLTDGTAAHGGHAVLGDDIVDVVAAEGDHGAGGELGVDGGHVAVLGVGHGLDGDDVAAALGVEGADGGVALAAGTGVVEGADGLGGALAEQVHVEGGVHGHHVVILGDDTGVVDVAAGHETHAGVLVQEVVQAAVAQGKGGHDLALVDVLLAAGDDAGFHQVHDAVGDHLGVDAQVMLVHEALAHGIGDTADAQLDGVAVVDQAGDVSADGALHGSGLGRGDLGHGGVALHDEVHLADVNFVLAVDVGHIGRDLHDDHIGLLQQLTLLDKAGGHTEVAVLVHGSDGHHEHVHGVVVHPADDAVVEAGGEGVGQALAVGVAGGTHHEDAVGGEGLLAGGIGQEGIVTHTQAADELDVVYLAVEGVELAEQAGGLVGGGAAADDVAVLDVAEGLLHGNQLGSVLRLIGHSNYLRYCYFLFIICLLYRIHPGFVKYSVGMSCFRL